MTKSATSPVRGRGRPSLGAAARSKQVMLRFKKSERALVESVVASWNAALPPGACPLTVAGWIRSVTLESLNGTLEQPPGGGRV